MSTPTTARGALLRRAGTLLVAAALVGGPTTSALADPSASPTTSPAATATADATSSPSPSATGTSPADPTPTPTTPPTSPAPSTTTGPTGPAPSPSSTATPSGSATPTPTPSTPALTGLVPGGRTTAFGPDAAAGPATSTDPTLVAAHYLAQQLAATGYMLQSYGYPDPGLTADAILALDAAGTGQDAAAAATQKLVADPVGYTGFGDPKEIYAGAVAKLLNVAIAQGIDPAAFGGFDVLTTLTGLERPNGRFSDVSAYGDNSNTFGQSFALIGLHRAGATVNAQARSYLLAQQCPSGGFKLYMDDAGCTKDSDADPDATAMAVQALIAVGGASAEVGDALDYLTGAQGASGGVSSPAQGVNANTTGLAGQAFLAGGRTAQARAAATYLTGLQYGCTFPASIRGGIAYDQASYADQKKAGSGAKPVDIDRRSTSQALLALAGTPLATVTADGAAAVAPALTCSATSSPTTTPSASVEPTSTGGATGGSGGGSTPSGTVDSSATGSLAQTGTDLLLPALLGLALVVLGALAVVASTRRRGAHA